MYNLTTLYINSGRNERTEIIAFIENEEIDVIFVGEPHIEDNETEEREGYAKLNEGKMVAAYAKTKILENIEHITETEHTTTIKMKDGTGITAIYIQPSSAKNTIKHQEKMLEEIPTNFENHTVIGDTNARHQNWDTGKNAYGKRMEAWGRENNYELQNKFTATHEKSCIDHIWNKGRPVYWKVGKPIGTGKHHAIYTTIRIETQAKPKTVKNWKKADWKQIEDKLRKLKPKTAEELDDGIRTIIEETVPVKLRITAKNNQILKSRKKEWEKEGTKEAKEAYDRELEKAANENRKKSTY
jgi:hypothetical protein